MDSTIRALSELGMFFAKGADEKLTNETYLQNPWFTPENINLSLGAWAETLSRENLSRFAKKYDTSKKNKAVAIIMAGNIPLVGFHDLMCVLLSGNIPLVKMSSQDSVLMALAIDFLNKRLDNIIKTSSGVLSGLDALIATGSSSSKAYFGRYMKGKRNIVRKTRNSAAIISGDETREELAGLALDIFAYFGLGCRSISKLFLPQGYDISKLMEAFEPYSKQAEHNKYKNNYDYRRALFSMQSIAGVYDNGFILLFPDQGLSSPIATLSYEFYSQRSHVDAFLNENRDKIQVVTGKGRLAFGLAQKPEIDDFADGVDTMRFLENL